MKRHELLLLAIALGVTVALVVESVRASEETVNDHEDPLIAAGIEVSTGAAPGYVADVLCGDCHQDLWTSYQDVGMARAFHRPTADRLIEDFEAGPFFHAASSRYYEMTFTDGKLLFTRYQLDQSGERINKWSTQVDWVMGSGNHSRVYLYRTPYGEMYQLPLAWYTQTASWGMAPGFDNAHHLGVNRLVRRECMFCHNAYPQVPVGSDRRDKPHRFPVDLPEGIGCQRCHGPGADHLRTVLGPDPSDTLIRSSIVNPGRLSPERRDAVCMGCHLQPSVSITGLRRFDRSDYSFQPGERLEDYIVHVDVVEADTAQPDRFEINHHPYRLMQSRCWTQSPRGKLSCLTCHDPHRKVAAEDRSDHYRAACQTCHEPADCGREHESSGPSGDTSCFTCHMPQRRTRDVVQVVMTDHMIQRRIPDRDLLAPLKEKDPVLVDVVPLFPERAPQESLWQAYRALAVLRAGGAEDSALALNAALTKARVTDVDPFLTLGRGLIQKAGRPDAGRAALRRVLQRWPDSTSARQWLAVAAEGLGDVDTAIAELEAARTIDPNQPTLLYNLALMMMAQGSVESAVELLEEAVRQHPTLVQGWFHLGNGYSRLDRPESAEASYRKALAVKPDFGGAYLALAQTLVSRGKTEDARRFLVHGIETVREPSRLEDMLRELD